MKKNIALLLFLALFLLNCEKENSSPNLSYVFEQIITIQNNTLFLYQNLEDSTSTQLREVSNLILKQEDLLKKLNYNLSLDYSENDFIINSLEILSLIERYSFDKDTIKNVENKIGINRFDLYNLKDKNDIIIILTNLRIIFNYLLNDLSRFTLLNQTPNNISPTITIFGKQFNTSYKGNLFYGLNLKDYLLFIDSNKTKLSIIDSSNYWILEYNQKDPPMEGKVTINLPNEILKNINFKIN